MTAFARSAVRTNAMYAPRVFRGMGRAAGAAALFTAISIFHAAVRGYADNVSPFEPYNTSRLQGALIHAFPSQWLQSWLGTTGAPADAAVLVWRTLFVLPVLIVVLVCVVWGWRACLGLLAVHTALLLSADCIYAIIPTRPPWMDISVDRIIAAQQSGAHYDNNQFAALPSLHLGLVVAYGLWFAYRPHAWRWLRIAYAVWALAMAWAIVYTGEHYLIDAVTGAAWAGIVFYVVRRCGWAYARAETAIGDDDRVRIDHAGPARADDAIAA
jgi:hypothetical protein